MELQPETVPEQGERFSIWELWPLPVAVFFGVFWNTTYLMAWMKWLGVPDGRYYQISLFSSLTEMLWWFWFFGWFGRSVAKSVAKMDFVQRWIKEFKLRGFPDRINWLIDQAKPIILDFWEAFRDEFRELFDPPEGWRKRFFQGMLAFLKAAWWPVCYVCLFMLGAVPHLNILLGIPICRALNRHGSLIALMAGNVLTVYTSDKLVDLVFAIWAPLPTWSRWTVLAGIVLLIFLRHRRRKATRRKNAAS